MQAVLIEPKRLGLMICAWLLLLLGAGSIARAAVVPSNIQAHATNDRYWIAQTYTDKAKDGTESQRTVLHTRARNDDRFAAMGELRTHIDAMTHLGPELVVLLPNGEWRILWGTESRSGIRAPDQARLITVAGEGRVLHAIARQPIATEPTTAPADDAATENTTAETEADASVEAEPALEASADESTQAPAPTELHFYTFESPNWVDRGALPIAIQASSADDLSIAVFHDRLTIGVRSSQEKIDLWQLVDDQWTHTAAIDTHFPIARFELTVIEDRDRVWITDGKSAGQLYLAERAWKDPVTLDVSTTVALPFAVATHSTLLRFVYPSGDKLFEQAFSHDGTPEQKRDLKLTPLMPTHQPGWQNIIVLALMAYLMLAVLRGRPTDVNPDDLQTQGLQVAGLRRRLVAGLIDLIPYFGSAFYLAGYADSTNSIPLLLEESWARTTLLAGTAIYIAHTTLTEMFYGRSIGKIIMGLNVVQLNGQKPARMALLMRNVMRALDLTLAFLPLVTVFYTPFRQRLGDVAAGTVVVTRSQTPPPLPKQEE